MWDLHEYSYPGVLHFLSYFQIYSSMFIELRFPAMPASEKSWNIPHRDKADRAGDIYNIVKFGELVSKVGYGYKRLNLPRIWLLQQV